MVWEIGVFIYFRSVTRDCGERERGLRMVSWAYMEKHTRICQFYLGINKSGFLGKWGAETGKGTFWGMCRFADKFFFFPLAKLSLHYLFFVHNSSKSTCEMGPYQILHLESSSRACRYCSWRWTTAGARATLGPQQNFLILFVSHCAAPGIPCSESRSSLSSKATLSRVSCSSMKWNLQNKTWLIHFMPQFTWAMVFLRNSSLCFFFMFSCPAFLPFLSLGKKA